MSRTVVQFLLGHPGGKVVGLVGVVPPDVLPEHGAEEEPADSEHLVLGGRVQASHEDVAHHQVHHANQGRAKTFFFYQVLLLHKDAGCKLRQFTKSLDLLEKVGRLSGLLWLQCAPGQLQIKTENGYHHNAMQCMLQYRHQ